MPTHTHAREKHREGWGVGGQVPQLPPSSLGSLRPTPHCLGELPAGVCSPTRATALITLFPLSCASAWSPGVGSQREILCIQYLPKDLHLGGPTARQLPEDRHDGPCLSPLAWVAVCLLGPWSPFG